MRIGKKPVMRFWRRENTKKNWFLVKSVRCLLLIALLESLPCDALKGIGVDERQNRVFIDLHGAVEYAPQVWDLVKGLPVELQWGPPLSAYKE